jgi:hypothetical protein
MAFEGKMKPQTLLKNMGFNVKKLYSNTTNKVFDGTIELPNSHHRIFISEISRDKMQLTTAPPLFCCEEDVMLMFPATLEGLFKGLMEYAMRAGEANKSFEIRQSLGL